MRTPIALLGLALVAEPLAAQGAPAGLRPVPVAYQPGRELFQHDSATTSGFVHGLAIGAGTGAGFYFLLFAMFGRGDAQFEAKGFLTITVIFALVGGFVGAIVGAVDGGH